MEEGIVRTVHLQLSFRTRRGAHYQWLGFRDSSIQEQRPGSPDRHGPECYIFQYAVITDTRIHCGGWSSRFTVADKYSTRTTLLKYEHPTVPRNRYGEYLLL